MLASALKGAIKLSVKTTAFRQVSAIRRPLSTTPSTVDSKETIKLTFYEEAMDNKVTVDAPIGRRVLDVAMDNNIDIEGACGGELACSTCHVIVPKIIYDQLPPKKIEEEDMLDLAIGVTDT